MLKCPECGIQNTPDSSYCRRCGTHLQGSSPPEETTEKYAVDTENGDAAQSPADLLPSEGTVLQIRSPLDREGELLGLVGGVVTIGRTPECDLFLDDVTVSRKHARIVIDIDGYTVEDEGSLNGTYVNRRRIERHQLFDGDELQIGKFRMAFLEQRTTK